MLDFEPEFNVGLWTQFSLIKGSNLILELEPDDPIGQFNNMFWTSANDSISLSKKLTCWVLKGPTGQSSPGKATESRGVGVGVGGIIIYCFRFNMNHVIHPIETPPRLLAGEGGCAFSRFKAFYWTQVQSPTSERYTIGNLAGGSRFQILYSVVSQFLILVFFQMIQLIYYEQSRKGKEYCR